MFPSSPAGAMTWGKPAQRLSAALAPLGGLDWVRPGMKIAVKVNLISAMRPGRRRDRPSRAAHRPDRTFTRARRIRRAGRQPRRTLHRCAPEPRLRRLRPAAVRTGGAALNLDTAQTEAHAPEAVQARTFTYTRWLDDADAIIDFCKLKTTACLR